jgi:hypothetical protein
MKERPDPMTISMTASSEQKAPLKSFAANEAVWLNQPA